MTLKIISLALPLLLFLAFLQIFSIPSAHALQALWVRQFGTGGTDRVIGTSVDASGMYVVGHTGLEGYIRKYDTSGTLLWDNQINSSGFKFDIASAVVADGTAVYAVGTTPGTLPGQTSSGATDSFIIKYDTNGNEIWTRQFGTTIDDFANSVVMADSGSIFVAGQISNSQTGFFDGFLRKYDTDGNLIWTKQFGTSTADFVTGVAADGTGVYTGGFTFGTFPGQTSAGSFDAFIRKHDFNGDEIWTRQFGTSTQDLALGLTADATGVYIVGSTGGTLPGESVSSGAFIRKYDTAGNEIWTRQFNSSSGFAATVALAAAADGTNVFVSGHIAFAFPGHVSSGSIDAFVRMYDANGTLLSTRQFGTENSDSAAAISVDGAGIYVGGMTSGTMPEQTNEGLDDAFIAKLSKTPNIEPIAANDNATTSVNQSVTVTVITNDSDPDPDMFSFLKVISNTQGAHGSINLMPDNSLKYTPQCGFLGNDSFTYTIVDNAGGSATATVNVAIAAGPPADPGRPESPSAPCETH